MLYEVLDIFPELAAVMIARLRNDSTQSDVCESRTPRKKWLNPNGLQINRNSRARKIDKIKKTRRLERNKK